MYRSRVIIIRNQHIALIKRQRNGRIYYVIPGGGMEPGETPEQTAIRESYEELGLNVAIKSLFARVVFHDREHFYFHARVIGGHFGTGKGPEMIGQYPAWQGTYTPVWIPLKELEQIDLFPPSIAELVSSSVKTGWPSSTVVIRIEEKGTPGGA